jgi:hypothetical protein
VGGEASSGVAELHLTRRGQHARGTARRRRWVGGTGPLVSGLRWFADREAGTRGGGHQIAAARNDELAGQARCAARRGDCAVGPARRRVRRRSGGAGKWCGGGTSGSGARGFYLMPDLRLPDMWRHGDTEAHLVSGRRIDV